MDNQLIGTTQPFMLYVTPLSNENEVIESGPAVQVNAVKFPSKSTLTNIYKVGHATWEAGMFREQPARVKSRGIGALLRGTHRNPFPGHFASQLCFRGLCRWLVVLNPQGWGLYSPESSVWESVGWSRLLRCNSKTPEV